jgi:hypothetical protein
MRIADGLIDEELSLLLGSMWQATPRQMAGRAFQYLDNQLKYESMLDGPTPRTVYEAIVDQNSFPEPLVALDRAEALASCLHATSEALKHLLLHSLNDDDFSVADLYMVLILVTRVLRATGQASPDTCRTVRLL